MFIPYFLMGPVEPITNYQQKPPDYINTKNFAFPPTLFIWVFLNSTIS